ncbi:MAG: 1-deoxy-D-xylulose-5-phosphate synthase [Kiritimatiellae bacterium]|nr:1-deoxy-D-xylulose-5-phosphate synthase [Kiritimatiellia bacterium]
MSALDRVSCAADVKALAPGELPELAAEVRAAMLETTSRTGGHLASSLGAVELTIGLLRTFDPEKDRVLWDVGHQTYAWKILTGRKDAFPTLRQLDGITGFQNPGESACDAFISGHAGVALAAAEGFAAARDRNGGDENVVAVVGDASLTNGMNLEALNTCAQLAKKVIVVLNDNEMSISRNVGSFARLLGRTISGVRYNRVKAAAERAGHKLKLTFLRGAYHKIESRLKSLWLGNSFFEQYGLRYIGPVDGHDLKAVENALQVAKEDKRGVVVHVVTVKGKGYAPAERNPVRWHGVGPFDRATGEPAAKSSGASWSDAFGAALCALARRDPRVCAVTAAMKDGTGLSAFAREFPDRFFDVGICEGQAVSFAAGLAAAGMRPVVAIYSTFLQRAVDQIQHDACLQHLPVTFAIDRAGCVGADGATHHGLYDVALLRPLPGMTIRTPTDAADLAAALDEALAAGGPWAIRYPRGAAAAAADVAAAAGTVGGGEPEVTLLAVGDQVAKASRVRELLAGWGVAAAVTPVNRVKPAPALPPHPFAVLENGAVAGGFGEAVGADFRFGWPDCVVGQGPVEALERRHGFDAESIAAALAAALRGKERKNG